MLHSSTDLAILCYIILVWKVQWPCCSVFQYTKTATSRYINEYQTYNQLFEIQRQSLRNSVKQSEPCQLNIYSYGKKSGYFYKMSPSNKDPLVLDRHEPESVTTWGFLRNLDKCKEWAHLWMRKVLRMGKYITIWIRYFLSWNAFLIDYNCTRHLHVHKEVQQTMWHFEKTCLFVIDTLDNRCYDVVSGKAGTCNP